MDKQAHPFLGELEGSLVSLHLQQFNDPPLVGRQAAHLLHHVTHKLHSLAEKLQGKQNIYSIYSPS